jgi:hypothetical protein
MGDYWPFRSTCLAIVVQGILQLHGQPLLEFKYSSDQISMRMRLGCQEHGRLSGSCGYFSDSLVWWQGTPQICATVSRSSHSSDPNGLGSGTLQMNAENNPEPSCQQDVDWLVWERSGDLRFASTGCINEDTPPLPTLSHT